MEQPENTDYTENGITVGLKPQHDKPTKCQTFFNPKMVICREFVLACLKAYCDEDKERHVKCLDAFGATGVGGLQWKRHLGRRVAVAINDIASESVEEIKKNCTKNGMEIEDAVFPDGYTIHNTLPQKDPTDKGVELISADANVTMHLRQFHFIHVDPYGCTANFLDAAFRNIYNKGVMVITSTDVGSIYGKNPEVALRNYGVHIKKADYFKEMAARAVLTAVVRAAARCNKGLEVLYTVAVEHFVQVAVRIKRGAKHADDTLTSVRRVLHCVYCEEYAILPNERSVSDKIYNHLPCTCHKENPGKSALELGPMWCGGLFSIPFIEGCARAAKDLKLSTRCQNLLHSLKVEACCPLEDTTDTKNGPSKSSPDSNPDKTEDETNTGTSNNSIETSTKCVIGEKRKPEYNSTIEPPQKKVKRESRIPDDQTPLFYYDIHKKSLKGYDIPKANKFVGILHKEGYRASRTTFDPTAIRTNATLGQVTEIIHRRCSVTPKQPHQLL